jgi:hypothetical protein
VSKNIAFQEAGNKQIHASGLSVTAASRTSLGLLQDRNVWVGVFPEVKEIVVDFGGFDGSAMRAHCGRPSPAFPFGSRWILCVSLYN